MSIFNFTKGSNKVVQGDLYLLKKDNPEQIFAQIEQSGRSTSGSGARASYQTMFPEISARWSLLEPSFRYLSPGIGGEKCRPLDHMWQIPFIHSVQFLVTSHFCIHMKVLPVISSMWYLKVRLCTTGIWQLRMCFSNTLCPRLRTIIQDILTSILYVLARIDTKYMEFLYAHLLNKRNSS